MASPIFKNGAGRIVRRTIRKKTYKPPKPHQCREMRMLGTYAEPLSIIWDCTHGWWVVKQVLGRDLNYQFLPQGGIESCHLRECPYCSAALAVVNQVEIT